MIQEKVKIVATIGPVSASPEMILKLAKNGVSIFRLNLAFHNHLSCLKIIRFIRQAEKEVSHPLAVLCDLAGPKIRIFLPPKSLLKEALSPGQKIKISSNNSKDGFRINAPGILKSIKKGTEIFLGDGITKLEAERKIKDGILAKVIAGGKLVSGMGFAARGVDLPQFHLSKKDIKDIKALRNIDFDALAISFIQKGEDMNMVRELLPKSAKMPLLIAKIETAAAVRNIKEIIEVADGIMVARGDLGFSVPIEELPHIQKDLISLSVAKAKPVITATQMLESMIYRPLPTRAEVTDVANAILDGTDAIMLSSETAIGSFPLESVKVMAKIAKRAAETMPMREVGTQESFSDVIADSAVKVAMKLKARLIVVFTQTGATARRISRYKPMQPIIALSPDILTIRKLSFSFGVFPYLIGQTQSFYHLISQAKALARENSVLRLKKNEPFVISAGIPFGKKGTTNLVLVQRA